MSFISARDTLLQRLEEPAPGRIQLLTGPRQVGKTTLLLDIAERLGEAAIYAAGDSPEAALPGFWERVWSRAEQAAAKRRVVILLDEGHLIPNWAARLKGEWDRIRRKRIPIHVVVTGSSALRVATGSRESLAGRFERITLSHWTASALSEVFKMRPGEAAEMIVRFGSYPGAVELRMEPERWMAYIRDAIIEPAIGRDMLALAPIRRPALLRQVFSVCISSPAQIVSLQKLQGQLQDAGALETISHYLFLLEEAYLVAPLSKYSKRAARQRAAPPKLVTLNNALLSAAGAAGPKADQDPERFGRWVENACIAHAWNSGQKVWYWREEPFEVDAIIEGPWGSWAAEIKTGRITIADLRGLLEFTRRFPEFRPLLICDRDSESAGARADIAAVAWQDFLFDRWRK